MERSSSVKQGSSDKYRNVVESILPDEAKKYAPLVLGRVKAHLGSLSRDDNYYHTVIGANALLKAWQKWQEKKEQYTEAQFLALAKAYVHGYLLNNEDHDITAEKSARHTKESIQRYEREDREDEKREIQEAQARAAKTEPAATPELPREDPYFSIFHYRVQLLPIREKAFMKWLHYTGSVAGASEKMNLTRQAGNDIKRSAEKILEGYAARLENGEGYSRIRKEVEAKWKPSRYDVFLEAATETENRWGSANQAVPIVDEDDEEYNPAPDDDDWKSDDWQYDLMVNKACYREDMLGLSSYDDVHGG